MKGLEGMDLDTAPCGFISFADDGMLLSINTTLIELLGFSSKDEMEGKKFESILGIAGRIFYQTHFFPLLKLNNKVSEIFFNLQSKEGHSLPMICNATRKQVGGIYENHCILLLVEERDKYEKQLIAAKKMAETGSEKDAELLAVKQQLQEYTQQLDSKLSSLDFMNRDLKQFGKVISHDLQEPIRKISVLADILVNHDTTNLNNGQLLQLGKINKECKRLRTLVTNLDRFMSLNINAVQMQEVDLDTIAKSCFKLATSLQNNSRTELFADPLPTIEGYGEQIKTLFSYLFDTLLLLDTNWPNKISIESSIVQLNNFRNIKDKYRYVDFVKLSFSSDDTVGAKHHHTLEALLNESGTSDISLNFGLAICKKIMANHNGFIKAAVLPQANTAIEILLPLKQG